MLFNCFISHGYLPRDFRKTAIVPITKNKSGNSSEKANYRPIALVTACSKILESCLLIILEKYLHTYDQQFGIKSQHSYPALFIIVLLMLNWNYLKVTLPHFTVVIYGLHTKSQHLLDYV